MKYIKRFFMWLIFSSDNRAIGLRGLENNIPMLMESFDGLNDINNAE
jgi:hypothetical protein